MNEPWVFLNGNLIPERLATIPVSDRGFVFGDGIFTTMRIHQGKCELYNAHLQRLHYQAAALNFALPPLQPHWIQELIQCNQAGEGTWRLKVIVTVKQEGMIRTAGNMLMTLHPYQAPLLKYATLCLFPHSIVSPLSHIKSLSYLDHLYIRNYAQQQGYEDAITKTSEAFLLETAYSNLFWIHQETCWVPDLQLPYLKGVFLQALLSHLSLPIHFVKATINQIPANARIYTCNALTHVRAVKTIEHQDFPLSESEENLLQVATAQALTTDHL